MGCCLTLLGLRPARRSELARSVPGSFSSSSHPPSPPLPHLSLSSPARRRPPHTPLTPPGSAVGGGLSAGEARAVHLRKGAVRFNDSAREGIEYLRRQGVLSGAASVAHFLRYGELLDGTAAGEPLNSQRVGEYLGSGPREEAAASWHREVLSGYMGTHSFSGLTLICALRALLEGFRLPGEAQMIDRLVAAFAEAFSRDNPGAFASVDTAYTLAFAAILLNTDLHTASLAHRSRMSMPQFVSNLRGVDGGRDIPHGVLTGLYLDIAALPILSDSVPCNVVATFFAPERSGWLHKRRAGAHLRRWRARFFLVTEGCLYYFANEADLARARPRCIVPLEDTLLREEGPRGLVLSRGGPPAPAEEGPLLRAPPRPLKSAKRREDGSLVLGTTAALALRAGSRADRDAWLSALAANCSQSALARLAQGLAGGGAGAAAGAAAQGGAAQGAAAPEAGLPSGQPPSAAAASALGSQPPLLAAEAPAFPALAPATPPLSALPAPGGAPRLSSPSALLASAPAADAAARQAAVEPAPEPPSRTSNRRRLRVASWDAPQSLAPPPLASSPPRSRAAAEEDEGMEGNFLSASSVAADFSSIIIASDETHASSGEGARASGGEPAARSIGGEPAARSIGGEAAARSIGGEPAARASSSEAAARASSSEPAARTSSSEPSLPSSSRLSSGRSTPGVASSDAASQASTPRLASAALARLGALAKSLVVAGDSAEGGEAPPHMELAGAAFALEGAAAERSRGAHADSDASDGDSAVGAGECDGDGRGGEVEEEEEVEQEEGPREGADGDAAWEGEGRGDASLGVSAAVGGGELPQRPLLALQAASGTALRLMRRAAGAAVAGGYENIAVREGDAGGGGRV